MKNLTNLKNNRVVALLQLPVIISLQSGKILGMIPAIEDNCSFLKTSIRDDNQDCKYFGDKTLKYENIGFINGSVKRKYYHGGQK